MCMPSEILDKRERPHQPFVHCWIYIRQFGVFLPRCMECSRGIAMGILSVRLSVCLSVRLSNACIVTKRKKAMFRFLYHMKEHLS